MITLSSRNNSSRRFKKVLLVNYSGFADYTSYYLVENGLAYLAAVLIANGYEATIHDLVTLDVSERLFPHDLMPTVVDLRQKVDREILENGSIAESTLEAAREIDAEVDAFNRKKALEIADEIADEILAKDIDVVGFKLWTQPSLRDVFALVRRIRERCPDVKLLAGGGHVDYFQERVLDNEAAFDAAFYIHGEVGLIGYLKAINGEMPIEQVGNLYYRDSDGKVVKNARVDNPNFRTEQVYPLYDSVTYPAMGDLSQKLFTVAFEDSRGCQFSCGFCAHPLKSGGLRLRDAKVVVDELEHLNKKYGFNSFAGGGSNTPFHHACRIFEGLKERNLDVAINFFQSLRDFKIERAQVMKESHIPLFWVGIESASDGLLGDSINKRRKMDKTKEICDFFNDAKIGYITSLIYPNPGETEETRRDTVEFIKNAGKGHLVIYPPLLQPGTPWMDSEFVEFSDRERFIQASQWGLEELENKVLPPMVADKDINESVKIDGRTYAEIYIENVRFRDEMNRVCGTRGYRREFHFTDELAPFMKARDSAFVLTDKALLDGDFDTARTAMRRYNELATSGSIRETRNLLTGSMDLEKHTLEAAATMRTSGTGGAA